jgi:tetratricopeptide (TPR) repeat protein
MPAEKRGTGSERGSSARDGVPKRNSEIEAMIQNKQIDSINELLRRAQWIEARRLLERARKSDPKSHWLITQLGVTYYEQGEYKNALKHFLASLRIVSDCPLTLWNLAGTFDSLGNYDAAMSIYNWLLQTDKSSEDDPCWESKAWTDALKTDCVYRVGVCFQHLGKNQHAEDCYRQYLNLLSIGMKGSYSIGDVKRQLQSLRGTSDPGMVETEFKKAVNATLQISGIEPKKGRQSRPPEFNLSGLVGGTPIAGKK